MGIPIKYLRWFASAYIIVFSIYIHKFNPVTGIDKLLLMGLALFGFFFIYFKISKAFILATVMLLIQFFVSIFHPESFRLSTLLYSVMLAFSFVSIYTLVYDKQVFTNEQFVNLIKGLIYAFFIVCIIQQCLILIGIRNLPWLNLGFLDRGLGCSSLSYEPSSFARFMFVYYFAYIKCIEYRRGYSLTIKELFNAEHRKITCMFLWMMFTMGSGTAFVCLALLSLNFINKKNWYYIIPFFVFIIFVVLPLLNFEQSNRAVKVMAAMTTFDQEQVEAADGSGASRISPLLNSFSTDFTQEETWLGHGTDYAIKNNLFVKQEMTLFDDYGLIWYISSLALSLSTAYGYSILTVIYMFSGTVGGANGNINYAWTLMIIISCIRYFHLNRKIINSNE